MPLRDLPLLQLFLRAYQCFCPCLAKRDNDRKNFELNDQEAAAARDKAILPERLLDLAQSADDKLNALIKDCGAKRYKGTEPIEDLKQTFRDKQN